VIIVAMLLMNSLPRIVQLLVVGSEFDQMLERPLSQFIIEKAGCFEGEP
jgi:hypothetical protein